LNNYLIGLEKPRSSLQHSEDKQFFKADNAPLTVSNVKSKTYLIVQYVLGIDNSAEAVNMKIFIAMVKNVIVLST